MEDWGSWLQGVSAGLVDKWASAEFVQPYEIQKMQLSALGQLGYYVEGKTGALKQSTASSFGVNPALLMAAGGALLLFLLVKD